MGERKKILVVDDDREFQGILHIALESEGYKVFSALDAMQGTATVRQLQPDLVILDIMMPAGGGAAVYARIKQIPATMNIPVIIHSGIPLNQIRDLLPANDNPVVLIKPVPIHDLISAVKRLAPPAL